MTEIVMKVDTSFARIGLSENYPSRWKANPRRNLSARPPQRSANRRRVWKTTILTLALGVIYRFYSFVFDEAASLGQEMARWSVSSTSNAWARQDLSAFNLTLLPTGPRVADNYPRSREILTKVTEHIVANPILCRGKDAFLQILLSAGLHPHSVNELCRKLPGWLEVSTMYGEDLVVHGLETCEAYQAKVKSVRGAKPMIRVAGLWNTGTNALAFALHDNLNLDYMHGSSPKDKGDAIQARYRVAWGKHNPASHKYRQTLKGNEGDTKELILPVVLVRDPYRWMNSMCKSPYHTKFDRPIEGCPAFVDIRKPAVNGSHPTFKVQATFEYRKDMMEQYTSLADLWTDWNREYYEVDFPRLMIRFEDFLFHAEKVMQLISQCTGVPMNDGPYKYRLERSKTHGSPSDFVSAVREYGTMRGRYGSLQPADADYAKSALATDLMSGFGYSYTPDNYNQAYDKKVEIRLSEWNKTAAHRDRVHSISSARGTADQHRGEIWGRDPNVAYDPQEAFLMESGYSATRSYRARRTGG